MCRCQEWRPPLARLAGEASPAQPWAALAWLGLDNHGGGDGGDQADGGDGDGDGGGGDGGGGDGDGGAACEVPEVRCSAARTQDTSHRHSPHLCSQLYKTSPYMGHSDCWAGLCVISRQLHAVL